MTTISTMVCIDYTPKQMYDLVNDVRSYPHYLPLCRETRILAQSPSSMKACITLAKGKIKFSFTTANTMEEGKRINMRLVEGPFKYLRGLWVFEPSARGGCEASFKLDFEFSNAVLGLAFGGFFKDVAESLVETFCKQADLLYLRDRNPETRAAPLLQPAGNPRSDVE